MSGLEIGLEIQVAQFQEVGRMGPSPGLKRSLSLIWGLDLAYSFLDFSHNNKSGNKPGGGLGRTKTSGKYEANESGEQKSLGQVQFCSCLCHRVPADVSED